MFKKRGLILLTLSLVLGFGAAMVAQGWVAEQTSQEVAQELRTTAQNVRVLRHRSMHQLRACMEGAMPA